MNHTHDSNNNNKEIVSFSPESKKGSRRETRRLTTSSMWFLQLFPLSHGRPSFIISLDLYKRSVVAQRCGYHCSSYWNNGASVTVKLIYHHRNAGDRWSAVSRAKKQPKTKLKNLKTHFYYLSLCLLRHFFNLVLVHLRLAQSSFGPEFREFHARESIPTEGFCQWTFI